MEIDEIKREAEIDNSRLEELLEKFFELTVEGKNEFVEILKESRLYMPIEIDVSPLDLENAKEGDVLKAKSPMGFDIKFLENEKGKAVPLFTGEEVMRKAGISVSTYVLYMSDLAEMLKQTDRYSFVVINPFTEHGLDIALESFLALFEEPSEKEKEYVEHMEKLLEVIRNHSIELEENTTLFVRADVNFMVAGAVDGVYAPRVPLYASSNPKYGEDLKYTNILMMPKSKRILPLGPDEEPDIIIAPGTEFKLEDTMDETQNLWMCVAQPFYE